MPIFNYIPNDIFQTSSINIIKFEKNEKNLKNISVLKKNVFFEDKNLNKNAFANKLQLAEHFKIKKYNKLEKIKEDSKKGMYNNKNKDFNRKDGKIKENMINYDDLYVSNKSIKNLEDKNIKSFSNDIYKSNNSKTLNFMSTTNLNNLNIIPNNNENNGNEYQINEIDDSGLSLEKYGKKINEKNRILNKTVRQNKIPKPKQINVKSKKNKIASNNFGENENNLKTFKNEKFIANDLDK